MKSYAHLTVATCLGLLLASPALAYDLKDAFGEDYGAVTGDIRVRWEQLQQDGKRHDATASTFRARLGYLTPVWNGLSAFGEIETIRSFGPGGYNDGINNHTGYPGINDPQDNGVNQLYMTYKNDDVGQARVGRQVITFDNQRFVGRSNFRQNDTTYDGVNLSTDKLFGWNLTYVNTYKINRGLGTRADGGRYDGDMNFFHAQRDLPWDINLALYTYLFNIEDNTNLSTRTHGGRAQWTPKDIIPGSTWQPLATAEVAVQSDFTNNPRQYTQFYQSYELGMHQDKLKLSGEFDSLGGNGYAAVQTPAASFHCQNGCVDKFTTTPLNGLEDARVQASVPLPFVPASQSLSFDTAAHYFHSTVHDQHYGNEVDATLSYSPWKDQTISASAGRYAADQLMTDTTMVYVSYELKF